MLTPYRKQNVLKVLLHVFTWILLLIFPVIFSQGDSSNINYVRLVRHTLTPLIFYAIIFYLNYGLLIEHFSFRKKNLVFVLINIALIVLFTWLHFEINSFLRMVSDVRPPNAPMFGRLQPQGPPRQFFIYKDIISMIIPIIIAFAVKENEKRTKMEAEKKEREKDLLNSELQHLRYQLQPHFFFNSLNTIYALIEQSPSLAQETVHSLAKLMRYLLYDAENGKVNLNEEVDFMKQYIELMKLRLSDKTKVTADFPFFGERYEVTPLLFISLIENAFKHGISATQPSEIFFSLTVKDSSIRFVAENTNFPKSENDKSGSGIGLMNLKKRLELLYPGKYRFETKNSKNLFHVALEIETGQA